MSLLQRRNRIAIVTGVFRKRDPLRGAQSVFGQARPERSGIREAGEGGGGMEARGEKIEPTAGGAFDPALGLYPRIEDRGRRVVFPEHALDSGARLPAAGDDEDTGARERG